MASLALPTLHHATVLPHPPAATPFPEVVPWRRILAVEPNVAVLHEKSLLLAHANYCVTRASSDRDLFLLRGTRALPLAILSDRLGPRLLGTVAETVRRQWPRTRILILGHASGMLEDYLYDEQIRRSPDPQRVLADLETLYKGMWNQRSNTLDWKSMGPVLAFVQPPVSESARTNAVPPVSAEVQSCRDAPSHFRLRRC